MLSFVMPKNRMIRSSAESPPETNAHRSSNAAPSARAMAMNGANGPMAARAAFPIPHRAGVSFMAMAAASVVMSTSRESSFSRTQVETFPAFSARESNAGPSARRMAPETAL